MSLARIKTWIAGEVLLYNELNAEFNNILNNAASLIAGTSPSFGAVTIDGTVAGAWTSPAFSAGNFTGSSSMTWTVASGDVTTYAYTIINKTMIVSFDIRTSTVGGTPDSSLQIAIPASKVATKSMLHNCYAENNGTPIQALTQVAAAGTVIAITVASGGSWSAATDTTRVSGQITFEIG